MKSVLETCKPRPEILAGTFNPEVFTASLGPIIDFTAAARELSTAFTPTQRTSSGRPPIRHRDCALLWRKSSAGLQAI